VGKFDVGAAAPGSYYTGFFGADQYNYVGISTAHNVPTYAPNLMFQRARGTHATKTANSAGDLLGVINFNGYTDSSHPAIQIIGLADTGWGASGADAPADLTFLLSPDGSATPQERMRIQSDGNVGIGTTTPTVNLDIDSTTHAQLRLDSSAATTASWIIHGQGETDRWLAGVEGSETSYQVYDISDSSTAVEVLAGGSSWTSNSDERMKKDVVDMENRLNDLLNINVRRFKWKADNKEDFGFVAQELLSFAPEAVHIGSDEVWSKEESENNPRAIEGQLKDPYGISRELLVPMIIKSIQDIVSIVDLASAPTNTSSLTINASGNVGIGTTSPTFKLELAETTHGANVGVRYLAENDAGTAKDAHIVNDPDAQFFGLSSGGVTIDLGIISTGAGVGNVGIGTTSPTASLTIRRDAGTCPAPPCATTPAAMLDFKAYLTGYDTESVKASIRSGFDGITSWNSNNGFMSFHVNKEGTLNEAMRIMATGNVGIGTTNPSYPLSIKPGTTGVGLKLGNHLIMSQLTDDMYIYGYNGATTGAHVYALGWHTFSSRRYKENIQPIQDALSTVQQLNGVKFDWKTTGKASIGLIAEDVYEIIPEAVGVDKETGEPESIQYALLVPYLVESVKEQQKEIENLRGELSELKVKLNVGQ